MSSVPRFFRRFRYLCGRRRAEAEMAEEMRFHLEQRAADFAADGLPEEEARYAAQRKFGNVASIQERARELRGWGWLDRVVRDVTLALRHLCRSPGFTVLAVVTLALGIGANTAMFSVFNGLVLKPLPYPEASELHRLYRTTAAAREGHFSAADFLDFERASQRLGTVAAYTIGNASLSEPGQPALFASCARSTVNLLSLLGVRPQLGRDFRPGEDSSGQDRVVIISPRTWQNHFGGDPGIIGRTLRVDGETHTIIGVLPHSFNDHRHFGAVDLFRPLPFTAEQAVDRSTTFLRLLFRQSPAHTPGEVASFVANFGAELAREFPEVNAETTWRSVPLREVVIGQNGASIMTMLIGLSGFVLLIACSNLANLLLARTIARAREFAVRAAVGASRLQLLRPLLIESVLLALAGGVLAILVALWFRDWAAVRSTGDNGEQVIFTLDWHVFTWAFGAAMLTAVAFAIAPALFALRLDVNETLKSGSRGATLGRGHQRFGRALIVGQFALAMILLAGAGIFVRGLHDLNHRRAGWDSKNVVTGTVLLPAAKYSDAEKISAFHRLALARLAALPGVASASISSFTPFLDWPDLWPFVVEGRERPRPGHGPVAAVNTVSLQYFDTYGTRLLFGRGFDETDTANSTRVFIVSESAARAFFGDTNAVGRRLGRTGGDPLVWGEIVGIVSDVQPVVAETNPMLLQVYQPMSQDPRQQNEIALRASGVAPAALVDSIRATIASLDPDLPVRKLQPADARIDREHYQLGFLGDILLVIAVLGLGLASLGIYGIIARTMALRMGEFAIRLALGARVRDLTDLVLASGVKLALVGSIIGLIGAFAVTRVIATGFPGMRFNSPLVLVGTTLMLVAVALVACWVPARRAGKVDATAVLRAE